MEAETASLKKVEVLHAEAEAAKNSPVPHHWFPRYEISSSTRHSFTMIRSMLSGHLSRDCTEPRQGGGGGGGGGGDRSCYNCGQPGAMAEG